MSCAEFWELTPRETVEWLRAAVERSREAARSVVTGAWFAEAFARRKRLEGLQKTLREVFGATPDERARSVEEHAERARGWFMRLAARTGGKHVKKGETADG